VHVSLQASRHQRGRSRRWLTLCCALCTAAILYICLVHMVQLRLNVAAHAVAAGHTRCRDLVPGVRSGACCCTASGLCWGMLNARLLQVHRYTEGRSSRIAAAQQVPWLQAQCQGEGAPCCFVAHHCCVTPYVGARRPQGLVMQMLGAMLTRDSTLRAQCHCAKGLKFWTGKWAGCWCAAQPYVAVQFG
jgi:hypothetical protein